MTDYLYDGSTTAELLRRIDVRRALSIEHECTSCERVTTLRYQGPTRRRSGWSQLRCSVCGSSDDYPLSLASIKAACV